MGAMGQISNSECSKNGLDKSSASSADQTGSTGHSRGVVRGSTEWCWHYARDLWMWTIKKTGLALVLDLMCRKFNEQWHLSRWDHGVQSWQGKEHQQGYRCNVCPSTDHPWGNEVVSISKYLEQGWSCGHGRIQLVNPVLILAHKDYFLSNSKHSFLIQFFPVF